MRLIGSGISNKHQEMTGNTGRYRRSAERKAKEQQEAVNKEQRRTLGQGCRPAPPESERSLRSSRGRGVAGLEASGSGGTAGGARATQGSDLPHVSQVRVHRAPGAGPTRAPVQQAAVKRAKLPAAILE